MNEAQECFKESNYYPRKINFILKVFEKLIPKSLKFDENK